MRQKAAKSGTPRASAASAHAAASYAPKRPRTARNAVAAAAMSDNKPAAIQMPRGTPMGARSGIHAEPAPICFAAVEAASSAGDSQ